MSKRQWEISVQKDEGFMLNVTDYGSRRFLVRPHWWFHKFTGHRWFTTEWAQSFMCWMDDDSKKVARIPLTWEQVRAIAPGEFDWSMHAKGDKQ